MDLACIKSSIQNNTLLEAPVKIYYGIELFSTKCLSLNAMVITVNNRENS